MSHFLHSLNALLLAYLRSENLTLVSDRLESNRLEISLTVTNNGMIASQ